MKQTVLPTGSKILQGLRLLRRSIIATIAAIALVVSYGLSSIGTQVVSTVGITGLTLASTATPAKAQRARRRRRRGERRRGQRRRRGRRRRRRRRGGIWEWYWAPYWYYW